MERTRAEELRELRSHIRKDGTAKITYMTREEAVPVANILWAKSGRPHNVYLCWQKPDHWHIGGGQPDDLEVGR